MAERIVVGSLAPQNWHRQARKLPPEKRFDHVYDKTVQVARTFGFKPMGIDFGLNHLPTTDRGYLQELAARMKGDGIVPAVGLGGLMLSNDVEVRKESVAAAKANLEKVVQLGATRTFFGAQFNGRVTREGRIRYCVEMAREVAATAKSLGLRMTQENFDYFLSDDLVRICREIDEPHVGVHSDTGNWLIMGEDPVVATDKVLPYTLHAHVRDYRVENHTYNGVAVGDGLVDFEKVLPLLAKAPVEELIFSMEVDTDDHDEDEAAHGSYVYLKNWLSKNGYL